MKSKSPPLSQYEKKAETAITNQSVDDFQQVIFELLDIKNLTEKQKESRQDLLESLAIGCTSYGWLTGLQVFLDASPSNPILNSLWEASSPEHPCPLLMAAACIDLKTLEFLFEKSAPDFPLCVFAFAQACRNHNQDNAQMIWDHLLLHHKERLIKNDDALVVDHVNFLPFTAAFLSSDCMLDQVVCFRNPIFAMPFTTHAAADVVIDPTYLKVIGRMDRVFAKANQTHIDQDPLTYKSLSEFFLRPKIAQHAPLSTSSLQKHHILAQLPASTKTKSRTKL